MSAQNLSIPAPISHGTTGNVPAIQAVTIDHDGNYDFAVSGSGTAIVSITGTFDPAMSLPVQLSSDGADFYQVYAYRCDLNQNHIMDLEAPSQVPSFWLVDTVGMQTLRFAASSSGTSSLAVSVRLVNAASGYHVIGRADPTTAFVSSLAGDSSDAHVSAADPEAGALRSVVYNLEKIGSGDGFAIPQYRPQVSPHKFFPFSGTAIGANGTSFYTPTSAAFRLMGYHLRSDTPGDILIYDGDPATTGILRGVQLNDGGANSPVDLKRGIGGVVSEQPWYVKHSAGAATISGMIWGMNDTTEVT